jgi:hypothetical protein
LPDTGIPFLVDEEIADQPSRHTKDDLTAAS